VVEKLGERGADQTAKRRIVTNRRANLSMEQGLAGTDAVGVDWEKTTSRGRDDIV